MIEALLALILISSFAPLTKTELSNEYSEVIEEKKLGDLSKAVSMDKQLVDEMILFEKTGLNPVQTIDLAKKVSSRCLQVKVNQRESSECESKRMRIKTISTVFDGTDFYSIELSLSE